MSEIVHIFKLIISEEFVGRIAAGTNHCGQQYKNYKDNIFSKRSRVNGWKPDTEDKIFAAVVLL